MTLDIESLENNREALEALVADYERLKALEEQTAATGADTIDTSTEIMALKKCVVINGLPPFPS